MEFKNKLQRHYKAIVKDLDVKYILDELYQKDAVTSAEYQRILNVRDREAKVRSLLEILQTSGTSATFEAFVDSLAKDYDWLYAKLNENIDSVMDESFEDSLHIGDVPRLPPHHVRREAIEKDVVEKLRHLKRYQILVLLGMSGSGKTCVAISALRNNPELIKEQFKGVVLWLNMGNCKTDDDIMAQQTKLLRKASSIYNIQNSMAPSLSMSSIGSIGDTSIPALDWTSQDLKDKLKTQFLEQSVKDCLLVLDEVNDRKCLEALDIGCRILVTTRDRDVAANSDTQIVMVGNSLHKIESLQIFASCLGEPVSSLPRDAKALHELCKGSPFHIALIGAQLADNNEQLKHDSRRWKYYVNQLKRNAFSTFFSRFDENPAKAIEVCINDNLSATNSQLFKKLAILPDNVKVSDKVLSKLWNKDLLEVNSIMKKLNEKTLVSRTYVKDQKMYLYEVHDIIMTYLRSCLSEAEKNKLHDQFLSSYNYTRNSALVEIPDDGYIAYYIGYHIFNTNNLNGKWGLFRKLFLDLKFLGNKVRLTGPADVISDLQSADYLEHIAPDDLDKSLVFEIKSFLSTHGTDLKHYKSTDIVQSILQHESQGVLYNRASEVAKIGCENNELYFDFLHEQCTDGDIKHSTIDVNETITYICFLGDFLLVGTRDGAVKFFHIPTNKLKKELYENESSLSHSIGSQVEWIGVAYSKTPPVVAVLFASGLLKLWCIDDIEQDDVIEEEPEETYNNNVPGTFRPIKSNISTIIKCNWTNNEEYLIAQTADMIILYKPNGEVANVIDTFERNCRLICSVPCSNDKYVAVATSGVRKGVTIVDLRTKERLISFEDPTTEADSVIEILAVPGSNKIITLKSRLVTQHEFKIDPNIIKVNTCDTRTIITSNEVRDGLSFLTMAVNKAGTLLFVSTYDSRVICVDLNSYRRLFDLDNRRGNVVTMAVSEIIMWDEFDPGADVLLTGTDSIENCAKVWYLDAPYVSQTTHKNGKVRLTTTFDVSFVHNASPSSPASTPTSIPDGHLTPKRHQSFANHSETAKKPLKSSLSLDRRGLKPLNLKGICNNNESSLQPLLAAIDDKNSIQVMRGKKLLVEITDKSGKIMAIKITPCNQHIIYGLISGTVKRYTLRTKEVVTIMDLYSPVQYMKFVHSNLLMVAGKNRCIMAYKWTSEGAWKTEMLLKGNAHLGSQEILNDIKGVPKKTSLNDDVSDTSSNGSLETRGLCQGGVLVDCFRIEDNIMTVECNATVKLWNKDLKYPDILNARRTDADIRCAAFKKNVLVICDSKKRTFQTFVLNAVGPHCDLSPIQEFQFPDEITACDLTADGHILAIGLRTGTVVLWNVKAKRQISLLNHHKSKVRSCSFSPVPPRTRTSGVAATSGAPAASGTDEPPLVLATMANEILWWDVSYVIRKRAGNKSRPSLNAMTPLASPHELRTEVPVENGNGSGNGSSNFFFAEGLLNEHCWRAIWRAKTCKQGSKKREILACIKLTGIYATQLFHDDKFSCFATIDDTGYIHVMNVMKPPCT